MCDKVYSRPAFHRILLYLAKPWSIYQTMINGGIETHTIFLVQEWQHIQHKNKKTFKAVAPIQAAMMKSCLWNTFCFHPACTFFNLSWTRLLSPPASGSPHVTTSQDNKLQTALHNIIGFLKGGGVLPPIFPRTPSGYPHPIEHPPPPLRTHRKLTQRTALLQGQTGGRLNKNTFCWRTSNYLKRWRNLRTLGVLTLEIHGFSKKTCISRPGKGIPPPTILETGLFHHLCSCLSSHWTSRCPKIPKNATSTGR